LQLEGANALAVTPTGKKEMLNVTGAVAPVTNLAVAVSTTLLPPSTTVRVLGDALRQKSKLGLPPNPHSMTMVKFAVLVNPPPMA